MLYNEVWYSPEDIVPQITKQTEDLVFLYSSLRTSYSGRYSYIAWEVEQIYQGNDYQSAASFLSQTNTLLPHIYGYFGYETEKLYKRINKNKPSIIQVPTILFKHFKHVLRFDHGKGIIETDDPKTLEWLKKNVLELSEPSPAYKIPKISGLTSNISKTRYLEIVNQTIEQIKAGNFYQANITRKFYGQLSEVDPIQLFLKLSSHSPAPYSAFMKLDDMYILSSSPELFLRIDKEHIMETRPIKGTLRKEKPVTQLQNSIKDKAENLMIVDLMRNDLSRSAEEGSVEVDKLYDIDSFSTVHHMSTTIQATLAKDKTVLDAVKGCFPPGSMTGAPKISAMQWCAEQEGMDRGIYSGALGWLTPDSCELSVVIRTLLLQGNQFEFQVGGGIVADSVPEDEWQESIDKALGIARTLGIKESELKAL